MDVDWTIIIAASTLVIGLIYKTVSYRQENKKLKLELDKYNDEKGPGVKKELSDLEDFISYFFKSFIIYARIDRSKHIPVVDLNPFILNFSISNYNHLFNILSKKEIDFIRTVHTSMTFISALTNGFLSPTDKIPKEEYNRSIDLVMESYLLSDDNKKILTSITEKIDTHFNVTCSKNSFTNEINILYDEARIIYASFKGIALS